MFEKQSGNSFANLLKFPRKSLQNYSCEIDEKDFVREIIHESNNNYNGFNEVWLKEYIFKWKCILVTNFVFYFCFTF